jgi:heterodisulfide reductase subunit A
MEKNLTPIHQRRKKRKRYQNALVIGGGVAGMQAALDIANEGYKTYLVEKTSSIGGKMAMLDKTFPTLDCSACILTPKLSEVSRHPNIELLTYSEVQKITGEAGSFKVKILRKARYVREDRCSGCGNCIAECPVEVPNEFDQGIGFRKSIYIPFPQATPNVCTVDMETCIKCNRCIRACDREAIDFDITDKIITLNVGSIVVATGYKLFNVNLYPRLGYGIFDNVIHALEYERLINAAGPTNGHLVRFSDGKIPKNIGFVQCVGARDVNKGVPYCSRICCMYGIKNAVMAKEHIPDANVSIYYADVRAFGKGYEEFYHMAETRFGVKFVRGRIGDVRENTENGNLIVTVEDIENQKLIDIEHELLVLDPGIQPPDDLSYIVQEFGLVADDEGYVEVSNPFLNPVDTTVPGIFVCGCAESPKDIPDSVSGGSAAAMRAAIILARGSR